MSCLWLVVYDISEDKIRKAVHDQLCDHGQPVQYSVFECRLEQQQLQQLRQTLQQLIEEHDRIRWYPLCRCCESGIQWQGIGEPVETNEFYLL